LLDAEEITGLIIHEYVPIGWTVTGAAPTHSSYNSETGKVTWVLYGSSLETQTIIYYFCIPENATGNETFYGEFVYRDEAENEITEQITGDVQVEFVTIKGDLNGDGTVSDFELLSYIDMWVDEEVTNFDLLEVIFNWVSSL